MRLENKIGKVCRIALFPLKREKLNVLNSTVSKTQTHSSVTSLGANKWANTCTHGKS